MLIRVEDSARLEYFEIIIDGNNKSNIDSS
jgi:hypothetical protein